MKSSNLFRHGRRVVNLLVELVAQDNQYVLGPLVLWKELEIEEACLVDKRGSYCSG